jgi:HD-like signal output (HDOD) protein
MREKILASVQAFPAMSPSATKLLRLMGEENSDAGDIEDTVRYDPGLSANVLRVANSAYFGTPGHIASIQQAVVRLGWKHMKQLVIAAAVNGLMSQQVAGYDLAAGELWRHALASTVATDVLARKHDIPAPDELFTASLLHDAGKLILGQYIAPHLDEINELIEKGYPFDAAERELLGTDHAEIGASIMSDWNFPKTLVDAVRWHHEPEKHKGDNMVVDLIHLGDISCMHLGIGVGSDGTSYEPCLASIAHIGLKTDQVREMADEIVRGLEELSMAFSFEPVPS